MNFHDSFPARLAASCLVAGLTTLAADGLSAQDYPFKPIRILTSEPGSGSDVVARLLAQGLTASVGQQVVVDNRGVLSAELTAKSAPDGYTLLLNGPFIWLMPFMRSNPPYDPLRDLAPVTLAVTAANILAVHPSLPVDSVQSLIALAKARPGQLNYGSSALGGTPHLAGELFKAMAGVDIVRVPYKGIAQAVTGLLGGEIALMFPTAGSARPHVNSGRLKALAITSAQPSPLFPGLPTVNASGLPGYESSTFTGVFAPAKTPAAVIFRLNQEMVRILQSPASKDRFAAGGLEVVGSTAEQFGAVVKADMTRMGKVIRDAGIRSE